MPYFARRVPEISGSVSFTFFVYFQKNGETVPIFSVRTIKHTPWNLHFFRKYVKTRRNIDIPFYTCVNTRRNTDISVRTYDKTRRSIDIMFYKYVNTHIVNITVMFGKVLKTPP